MHIIQQDWCFVVHIPFVCSNFNFLYNSQCITFPSESCLVLYYFCVILLQLFIMRLLLSYLSPHNLHLLFSCVLSILAWIWLVLMTFFLCIYEMRYCFSLKVYYYYYYCLLIRVFHISVSWWSFSGDCVTASHLKSPWLFSVFWPFSITLLFGWSPLGRQLQIPPGPLIIL